jgi:multidrug efflux pump subunit AcrB
LGTAQVLESTVAAPLENAINGVPRMIYMSSNSSSNGVAQIQVTFEIGTNVDLAAVNVNNRVKQAEARLPQEVKDNVRRNIDALAPYFSLWRGVQGIRIALRIVVVEPDQVDLEAPRIPKRTDGRALG